MLQKNQVFKAKTLELAVQEACRYFGVSREEMEVTVLQAAKSGIFGIIPMQEAQIEVSLLASYIDKSNEIKELDSSSNATIPSKKPKRKEENIVSSEGDQELPVSAPVQNIVKAIDIDKNTVISLVQNTMTKILNVLVEDTTFTVELETDTVYVKIPDGKENAILIGKDHENLLAMQHIVSRILSQQTQASFSISIFVGDVISSEETILTSMALRIAEKVKLTQKTQQTLPLPAYQRRIIHMTLQNDPLIGTTTKGSDALQSVVVFYQKKNQEKIDIDINSMEK